MNDAVIKHEPPSPEEIGEGLLNAARDPQLSPEKVRQYYELYRDMDADRLRREFDRAMSRLQAKLPQIPKYGQGKNSKYAKYEDLDVIVRPLLAEEGFSVALNEAETTEQKTTFVLEISRAGHTRPYKRTFHNDKAAMNREGKGIRPAIQDDGSTTSYARRTLLKMALNIVEKDEDNDGEDLEPISADQANDLSSALDEVRGDVLLSAFTIRFCKMMGVASIENILLRDLPTALKAIEDKRRGIK